MRSKAMFGTNDAYDVFGAMMRFEIDPPQLFTVQNVREEFFDPRTVNESSLRRNMAKAEAIGLIERVPSDGPAATYKRIDSPIWDFVSEMVGDEIERSLDGD